ncbi:MAG: rhomboid family intramembrane serine protease [Caulobacteraceae bacterium]|nr:rhomboid family intramembrane serine protease [Caulobacteraceae bacterium]
MLIFIFAGAFVAQAVTGGPMSWGLSGQALADGRWHVVISHMLAHAGLGHLFANGSALLALTPIVVRRFGHDRSGWARYGLLFAGSGFVGALAFVVAHLADGVPMVGASGAICGLWGAVARIRPEGGFASLWSRQVGGHTKAFAISNAVVFGIVYLLVSMSGGTGGIASEAHVGGFAFGLLATPWLAPLAGRTVEHTTFNPSSG